ncbi:MAG: SCP2 sterol-binding domain-containing protein [Deltaproteobacteria bacterium]|nr:SCP2 sterol-binding domain-containing protein [Deltaproteobacteria bacterium]
MKTGVRGQGSEKQGSGVRGQGSKYKEKVKEKALKAINLPLRFIPLWLEAIGAGVFIAIIIDRNPGFKERLKEIDDKIFLFEATDIGKGFYLHIKDGDIRTIPYSTRDPDVTMRGETSILFGLLLGKIDPDTVFFSRRLGISGDTAVAVHFKNILNSL